MRRRLGHRGEHRRLGDVDLAGRTAEVVAGRRLDAAGAVSEVDVVEVHLEDLVLAERVLDLLRDPHLEQLPGQRAPAGRQGIREDVARKLHRDGAEALVHARVADVRDRSRDDAREVDRAVVAEPAVLHRDECIRDMRWKGFQSDELALDG